MKTFGRLAMLVVGVAVVVAMAGCASGTSGGSGTSGEPPATGSGGLTVVERNFAFEPSSLEVKVGDTVTFVNEDSAPHVVSIDGKDLGNQNQGDSVSWTAEKAGEFPYVCTIHPSMTGTIVVK